MSEGVVEPAGIVSEVETLSPVRSASLMCALTVSSLSASGVMVCVVCCCEALLTGTI
jgi:hypothetical protein